MEASRKTTPRCPQSQSPPLGNRRKSTNKGKKYQKRVDARGPRTSQPGRAPLKPILMSTTHHSPTTNRCLYQESFKVAAPPRSVTFGDSPYNVILPKGQPWYLKR